MQSFGFIRGYADNLNVSNLRHCDWHSSVFEVDQNLVLVCGSTKWTWPGPAKCIASNSKHIFILDYNGVVTAFSKFTGDHQEIKRLPSIQNLAVNDDELFCITDDSFVISLKLHDFEKPTINYPLPMKIKSVFCGPGFVLFLTPSGTVFSKGIGSRGQLGSGDLNSRDTPQIIESLQPVTVVSIACGSWHSVCLTDTGDVYTWGSNEYGQLGLPSLNLERSRRLNDPTFASDYFVNLLASPSLIDFPGDAEIASIGCGSRHTACLSTDNKLFTFGWNGVGQLGFEPKDSERIGKSPHLTASDQINTVNLDCSEQSSLRLFCGHWSTVVQTNYFSKSNA